jgi:hypothetical protein
MAADEAADQQDQGDRIAGCDQEDQGNRQPAQLAVAAGHPARVGGHQRHEQQQLERRHHESRLDQQAGRQQAVEHDGDQDREGGRQPGLARMDLVLTLGGGHGVLICHRRPWDRQAQPERMRSSPRG